MKKERNYTQRLFLAYSTAMFVLLLILFAGIFMVIYNDEINKEINAQREFVSKTQQQIDTSLQNMDRIINGLLFNKSFVRIIKDEDISSSYAKYSSEVLDIIVSLDAPLFLSHRIIAFTPDTYFTFTKTGEDQTHILSAIESYAYYDTLTLAGGEKIILPVHDDPFGIAEAPVYSVARAITDGINVYGIIEVQDSYDRLKDFCSVDIRLGDVALLSKEGYVLYPREEGEDNTFFQDIYAIISNGQQTSGYFRWENNQISFSISDYSQWITVMYCPLSYIMPSLNLVSIFICSFIAVLILTLSLIYILTRRLTAPLLEFDRLINQVSFDNLSMPMPHSSNIKEIENINRSFQAMLSELKAATARNAQARANEERANYIALQSQMNPHTIYNTITMIESVCYINGDYEASNLCISFSQMLRYISDNTKSIYTVEDELQHLENYAALIKKRYEGRLFIETAADPKLLSRVISKFTLQPLVENSVKHGMNRNSQPFVVRVVIEAAATGWRIAVSDNGTGFSDEKLAEVYEQFAYCDVCLMDNKSDILKMKINNMALNNIYMRWKILKGTGFKMRIENSKPSGCIVELSVEEHKNHVENLSGGR